MVSLCNMGTNRIEKESETVKVVKLDNGLNKHNWVIFGSKRPVGIPKDWPTGEVSSKAKDGRGL